MHRSRIVTVATVLLAATMLASCNNTDKEKRRHVERGDAYAKEKRDEFALVEYASAVKLDPTYGEARLKLAETHERMNNFREAFAEFVRAADALPDNRDLQLKTTQLLLLAGRFDDAKARANALLLKDPKDVDAILLRANAMAGLRDPAGATAEIEEALRISPDKSKALVNLGAARMQSGDAKQAEDAFRQAITLKPDSVDARLALANFLWTAGRNTEAETALKEALAKDPKHLLANRMLALLYLSSKRVAEAEQPLKNIVESSNVPTARLQLADYYITAGRPNDATTILNSLVKEPATAVEAELRLAAIDYAQQRVPDAHRRLDALLARVPNSSSALVLKAQWLLQENKVDEALSRAQAAVSADPQSAPAHFALAMAQDRRNDTGAAMKSYQEVIRLNPRAVAAQVELSRLTLMAGDNASAQRFAEEARRAEPANLNARAAVVRTLIAAGNSSQAEIEITELLKDAPASPLVHTLNGMQKAAANNPKAARAAYERALQLSPGFVEAIGRLSYLDLMANDSAGAIARLEAEIAQRPNNPNLLVLLSRAYSAAGNKAKEEEALRRAVTADPRFTAGYSMLAQLYVQQRRLEEARAEFAGMVERDPSNVTARTMLGMLYEQQGKREDARKVYEAAVGGTANAPVAANNLAYMYAEEGKNLDMALQLATAAKQRLPDAADVDDTLGWVYYKKGMPALAVAPLQESLRKRPDVPMVLYHLGLTYAKLGDTAKAREALERAVKLDPTIGGGHGRQMLADLSK